MAELLATGTTQRLEAFRKSERSVALKDLTRVHQVFGLRSSFSVVWEGDRGWGNALVPWNSWRMGICVWPYMGVHAVPAHSNTCAIETEQVGSATAAAWYEQGYRSVDQILAEVDAAPNGDPTQTRFYQCVFVCVCRCVLCDEG